MASFEKPSQLELKILAVLWKGGPKTVREVRTLLPDDKSRAYTTVLSTMQVMEKKGLLGHTKQGATHLFKPLVSKSQVLGPYLKSLVRNLFDGNPATAVQHLLEETEVSRDELDQIQGIIRDYGEAREEESDV